MTARFVVGDVSEVLATIPDDSVDLILTSPPFLALRSYLAADHPDKGKEIGSEATPGEFIDRLLDLTEEWDRVLAPHGSICIELGDTYSGSGGAGGDYNEGGLRDGQAKFKQSGWRDGAPKKGYASGGPDVWRKDNGTDASLPRAPRGGGDGWPDAKSLCLIPELYRISLVYGFNPLTGRQTPKWRARNVVRWVRPNPPVGALGDKFRPATSELVVACKSKNRYFDLDAVRTENIAGDFVRRRGKSRDGYALASGDTAALERGDMEMGPNNPGGSPPLDWWQISTEPFKGSHYATWPRDLCVKPILAMCPQRICRTCGKPSERIVGDAEYTSTSGGRVVNHFEGEQRAEGARAWSVVGGNPGHVVRSNPTLGWTDCGHDDWRHGLVLDPFAGSGTTLAVATGHGRDCIGIDLDARNADLARERVGMFLEIETLEPVA